MDGHHELMEEGYQKKKEKSFVNVANASGLNSGSFCMKGKMLTCTVLRGDFMYLLYFIHIDLFAR